MALDAPKYATKIEQGPFGKRVSLMLGGGGEVRDIATLAKHANLTPSEARAAVKSMIDSLPDDAFANFLGAQLDVAS